jgi:quercetin dioxygenase-like cupin family protein
VEIRRFGVGNRRPDGPPGTVGVRGQPIFSDGRGAIAELAFGRYARVEPHTNPSTTWFLVIEGGGWVQVGEERSRISSGEAVLWPAQLIHAAWTELSEMRAFVVEFSGADDAALRGIVDGMALALPAVAGAPGASVARGEGSLAAPEPDRSGEPPATAQEGEPA